MAEAPNVQVHYGAAGPAAKQYTLAHPLSTTLGTPTLPGIALTTGVFKTCLLAKDTSPSHRTSFRRHCLTHYGGLPTLLSIPCFILHGNVPTRAGCELVLRQRNHDLCVPAAIAHDARLEEMTQPRKKRRCLREWTVCAGCQMSIHSFIHTVLHGFFYDEP